MIKALKETLKALIPDSPKKAVLDVVLLAQLAGAAYASDVKKPDNIVCEHGTCYIKTDTTQSKIAVDMREKFNSKANSKQNNFRHIYTINPDGSNLEKIITGFPRDLNPEWSPNGNKIASISARKNEGESLCIFDRRNNNLAKLFKLDSVSEIGWSDKGIAFEKNGEIYVLNSDNILKQVTSRLKNGKLTGSFCINPKWSDKNIVYFAHNKGLSTQFKYSYDLVINIDGKDIKFLSAPREKVPPKGDHAVYFDFDISKTGDKIIFSSNMNPYNKDFKKNDPRLNEESKSYDFKYRFNVFASHSEIYLAEIKGAKARNLVRLTNNKHYDGSPTFSPDGKQIAFISSSNGKDFIRIMDLKTKHIKQIFDSGDKAIFKVKWSPYIKEDTENMTVDAENVEMRTGVNAKKIEEQMDKCSIYSKIKLNKIENNDLSAINEKNAIVDVYTSWCGYCPNYTLKSFVPASEKYSKNGINFLIMDAEKNKEISKKYDIKAYPTTLIFKDGKLVDSFVGADGGKLENAIKKYYEK